MENTGKTRYNFHWAVDISYFIRLYMGISKSLVMQQIYVIVKRVRVITFTISEVAILAQNSLKNLKIASPSLKTNYNKRCQCE